MRLLHGLNFYTLSRLVCSALFLVQTMNHIFVFRWMCLTFNVIVISLPQPHPPSFRSICNSFSLYNKNSFHRYRRIGTGQVLLPKVLSTHTSQLLQANLILPASGFYKYHLLQFCSSYITDFIDSRSFTNPTSTRFAHNHKIWFNDVTYTKAKCLPSRL